MKIKEISKKEQRKINGGTFLGFLAGWYQEHYTELVIAKQPLEVWDAEGFQEKFKIFLLFYWLVCKYQPFCL